MGLQGNTGKYKEIQGRCGCCCGCCRWLLRGAGGAHLLRVGMAGQVGREGTWPKRPEGKGDLLLPPKFLGGAAITKRRFGLAPSRCRPASTRLGLVRPLVAASRSSWPRGEGQGMPCCVASFEASGIESECGMASDHGLNEDLGNGAGDSRRQTGVNLTVLGSREPNKICKVPIVGQWTIPTVLRPNPDKERSFRLGAALAVEHVDMSKFTRQCGEESHFSSGQPCGGKEGIASLHGRLILLLIPG